MVSWDSVNIGAKWILTYNFPTFCHTNFVDQPAKSLSSNEIKGKYATSRRHGGPMISPPKGNWWGLRLAESTNAKACRLYPLANPVLVWSNSWNNTSGSVGDTRNCLSRNLLRLFGLLLIVDLCFHLYRPRCLL